MVAAHIGRRLLVLLCQALVLSYVECALAMIAMSQAQTERLERIQSEAVHIVLGCTGDTSCVAVGFLLDFPAVEHTIRLARTQAYLKISTKVGQPLHRSTEQHRRQ